MFISPDFLNAQNRNILYIPTLNPYIHSSFWEKSEFLSGNQFGYNLWIQCVTTESLPEKGVYVLSHSFVRSPTHKGKVVYKITLPTWSMNSWGSSEQHQNTSLQKFKST